MAMDRDKAIRLIVNYRNDLDTLKYYSAPHTVKQCEKQVEQTHNELIAALTAPTDKWTTVDGLPPEQSLVEFSDGDVILSGMFLDGLWCYRSGWAELTPVPFQEAVKYWRLVPDKVADALTAPTDIDDLHRKIMDIQEDDTLAAKAWFECRAVYSCGIEFIEVAISAYKLGHRDARHAAAEIVTAHFKTAPRMPQVETGMESHAPRRFRAT